MSAIGRFAKFGGLLREVALLFWLKHEVLEFSFPSHLV